MFSIPVIDVVPWASPTISTVPAARSMVVSDVVVTKSVSFRSSPPSMTSPPSAMKIPSSPSPALTVSLPVLTSIRSPFALPVMSSSPAPVRTTSIPVTVPAKPKTLCVPAAKSTVTSSDKLNRMESKVPAPPSIKLPPSSMSMLSLPSNSEIVLPDPRTKKLLMPSVPLTVAPPGPKMLAPSKLVKLPPPPPPTRLATPVARSRLTLWTKLNWMVSAPTPPSPLSPFRSSIETKSLPSPPSILSVPVPAKMRSLPMPPKIVSSPPRPASWSFPPPPCKRLSLSSPVSVSLPAPATRASMSTKLKAPPPSIVPLPASRLAVTSLLFWIVSVSKSAPPSANPSPWMISTSLPGPPFNVSSPPPPTSVSSPASPLISSFSVPPVTSSSPMPALNAVPTT